MAGQRRDTALWGRLLLFAALLFGIVAMHSLGHCAEHPASPAAGASAGAASAHHGGEPGGMPLAHEPMDMAIGVTMGTGTASGARVQDDDPAPRAHAPLPLSGTDPAAVCLAVLGAVSLLALGAALARRADGPVGALARLPHALRPIPPPPHGRLLARTSVLRL
nr:hypothetical protein [Streptomyces benahoarensis]